MTWATLTDEQREGVRATLRSAIEAAREEGYDDDVLAHEVALEGLDSPPRAAEADRVEALRALMVLAERTGNLLAGTFDAGLGETWTTTSGALREARAVLARLTAKGAVQ